MGATQESPHIKTEPQEPHPEGASQEDRAQVAQGWVPLSQGSKEKALLLPGGGEERDVERGHFPEWQLWGEVAAYSPGGEEAPAMVRGDAWMSAHLPFGGRTSQPQSLLTLLSGGVGVGFEAAIGVPGMSPFRGSSRAQQDEVAALRTSLLSQPSPPPRSLCYPLRGGPETSRWPRRSSLPGPR